MFEKVIRDSVHGDIRVNDEVVWEIIDTPEIQRLRRILQLGGAQFAYPSATHNRFSHSVGVYHVVSLFLESQGMKEISDHDKLIVKLAGLMHDLGHGAFSHTFEKVTGVNHEQYTAEIILNKEGNIFKILEKHEIDPKEIVSVINGKHPNKVINLLVSSQLDADRLDYLMRDSYSCGVSYANLDINWIVRNSKIVDDKIVFNKKSIFAIESYLLGRYHMYRQVYNHKLSITFDAMFFTWFERVKDLYNLNHDFFDIRVLKLFGPILNGEKLSVSDYLKFDDYTMYDIFKICTLDSDSILSDLSRRILNRDLFVLREADEITASKLKSKITNAGFVLKYYFIDSTPKKLNIYKDSAKSGKDETIYIEDKDGSIKPLSELTLLKNSIDDINGSKIIKKYLFPKEIV
ncbi:HD domain-containing protein [Mesoplasma photuris]|uniref:HD domain-containing protein n=1 Tax=Mesoplasma photuris TaxID=217731 RepID=UPI0004E1454D|nr:HD domain-containing protein [Mesoplasma photuris]